MIGGHAHVVFMPPPDNPPEYHGATSQFANANCYRTTVVSIYANPL